MWREALTEDLTGQHSSHAVQTLFSASALLHLPLSAHIVQGKLTLARLGKMPRPPKRSEFSTGPLNPLPNDPPLPYPVHAPPCRGPLPLAPPLPAASALCLLRMCANGLLQVTASGLKKQQPSKSSALFTCGRTEVEQTIASMRCFLVHLIGRRVQCCTHTHRKCSSFCVSGCLVMLFCKFSPSTTTAVLSWSHAGTSRSSGLRTRSAQTETRRCKAVQGAASVKRLAPASALSRCSKNGASSACVWAQTWPRPAPGSESRHQNPQNGTSCSCSGFSCLSLQPRGKNLPTFFS